MENKNACDVCFRIECRQCTWVATDEEVTRIQIGEMTVCPECGWKPEEK